LFFHAITTAFDDDGDSMVKEAIQEGRRQNAVVVEDGGPLLKRLVGGQNNGSAFITGADDLKEQIGPLFVDRQVPDLIEDKQTR